MNREYRVQDITEAKPGEPHYLVTGLVQDTPLSRALIETGAIREEGGFNFLMIDDQPSVRFKSDMSADIYVWPEVQKARAILARAISQAKRISKILEALEKVGASESDVK